MRTQSFKEGIEILLVSKHYALAISSTPCQCEMVMPLLCIKERPTLWLFLNGTEIGIATSTSPLFILHLIS
jgi:hypothetical protein